MSARTSLNSLSSSCPEDRILDVRATAGYVSCALLHKIRRSRVVTIEPQPDFVALLETHLEQPGSRRGLAIRAEISSESGTVRLLVHATNNGRSHLIRTEESIVESETADLEVITTNNDPGRGFSDDVAEPVSQ